MSTKFFGNRFAKAYAGQRSNVGHLTLEEGAYCVNKFCVNKYCVNNNKYCVKIQGHFGGR